LPAAALALAGMNQPWGLSGPQFLGIYGTGLAAFVAAPWLLALLARTFGTASTRAPAPVLDAYEVGYLAGGAQRAAEVVIGELTASGALRVDSTGQISQAGPAQLAAWSAACAHGIAAHAIPDGLSTQRVQQWLAEDPGITGIGARLRAGRLLIARSWVTAARLTAAALWLALMVAGALRLAEGAHNHRPIGDLTQLYFLTVLLGINSLTWLKRLQQMTTRAGAAHLRRMGQRELVKQVKDQLAAQRKAELAAKRAERKARRAGRHAVRRDGAAPAGDATIASTAFAEPAMPGQEPAGSAPARPSGPLPGLTAAGGDAALLGIALAGLGAMQDPALRTALLAGQPSSGGGGGGGCGGGCGG
jgi:uncharacterized protein (TIGR04222 family)